MYIGIHIYIYYNYRCISMVGLSITNTHKVGYTVYNQPYQGTMGFMLMYDMVVSQGF